MNDRRCKREEGLHPGRAPNKKLQIRATHTETLSTDFLFWQPKCLCSNRLSQEGAVAWRPGQGDRTAGSRKNYSSRERQLPCSREVFIIGKQREIHNRKSREKKMKPGSREDLHDQEKYCKLQEPRNQEAGNRGVTGILLINREIHILHGTRT